MKIIITPLVSVCIAAYNAKNYIRETIESIVNQTYSNLEIIIIEDGSNDDSEDIIKSFNDCRIKYVKQKNGGAGSARNHALRIAKGEFIKIMDSDDLINETAIASQLNLALQHPNCVISGKWGRFYHNDKSDFKYSEESVWRDMKGLDWIIESWINGANMTQPGIFLIPKSLTDTVGFWKEEFSKGPIDDMDYFTRLILKSPKIIFCKDSILMYRSGLDKSLSKKKNYEGMSVALETIKASIKELLNVENSSRTKKAASVQLQLFIYEVFNTHHDLYKKAKVYQSQFGINNFKLPGGGIRKILRTLLGWKITKILIDLKSINLKSKYQ